MVVVTFLDLNQETRVLVICKMISMAETEVCLYGRQIFADPAKTTSVS